MAEIQTGTKMQQESAKPKSELGGIVVLDFGGQYTQLIARRIREQRVFSAILPCSSRVQDILAYEPAGIVLSGGPSSVYDSDAPKCDPEVLSTGAPVLGFISVHGAYHDWLTPEGAKNIKSQPQRQREQPLLSTRAERAHVGAIQLDREIVPVRTDEREATAHFLGAALLERRQERGRLRRLTERGAIRNLHFASLARQRVIHTRKLGR